MTTGDSATGPHRAGALQAQGDALVRALETRATAYHVKSDAHDILLWEAAVIAARVAHVVSGSPPLATLAGSVIDSSWRHDLHTLEPDLVARVRAFHHAADAALATTTVTP